MSIEDDIIVKPATPAPSQPAGAREWLLARDYEMFLSSHVGMLGKLLCDTMELFAAQQTAAKDAINLANVDELERTQELAAQLERERDSLRVENAALKAGKE